jgi:hypothetical protein
MDKAIQDKIAELRIKIANTQDVEQKFVLQVDLNELLRKLHDKT